MSDAGEILGSRGLERNPVEQTRPSNDSHGRSDRLCEINQRVRCQDELAE